MGSYDRIDWHYGGDFPKNLPPENGGTHIGMFLTWIIESDLIGDLHREESQELLQKVLNRQITGRDFLIEACDEKFWEEDLNEEGNEFTKYYFDSDDGDLNYVNDYSQILGDDLESLYEVEDSWENYDKLKPILDSRYRTWRLER